VAPKIAAKTQAFPELQFSTTSAPAGWTMQTLTGACSNSAIFAAIAADAAKGTPYIVNAGSCPIDFSPSNNPQTANFTLSNNLMIVTTGNITFENGGSVLGSNGYTLSYVVPYAEKSGSTTTTTSCSSGGSITASNPPTYASGLDVLFYTPCDVTFQNNLSMAGQLYAGGTLSLPNQATLAFNPFTVPFANLLSGSGTSSATVTWERQPN
jgi:hypothetical protein